MHVSCLEYPPAKAGLLLKIEALRQVQGRLWGTAIQEKFDPGLAVVTVAAATARVIATGMAATKAVAATAETVPTSATEAVAAPAIAMTSTPAKTTEAVASTTEARGTVVPPTEDVKTAAGVTRRLPIAA